MQLMGTERQNHMTIDLKMFFSIEIIDLEKSFRIPDSILCKPDLSLFQNIIPFFFQGSYKKSDTA